MEKNPDLPTSRPGPGQSIVTAAFQKTRTEITSFEDNFVDDLEKDANAKHGDRHEPILGVNRKTRRPIKIPKASLYLFLICWITFVFLVIVYTTTVLEDNTTLIIEKIKDTAAEVHGSIVDTYEELKHPGNAPEVADLMTKFYELLSKMGYYEPSLIDRPPHTNPAINRTYAETLGYSQKAIEMMEMLPYLGEVNEDEDRFAWSNGEDEFLLYGTFVDYRDVYNLENEDPLYALDTSDNGTIRDFNVDGGRYMKPDYVLLSQLGNHGSLMVLNTKNYKLWTIDSEGGDSSDPALKDVKAVGDATNSLSLDNYSSRPARVALRDYMQKFIELEWMPGGLWKGSWEGDEYARLYLENGWPNSFNRDAFMSARLNWVEEEAKRWHDEQPFEEVKKFEQWLNSSLLRIERDQKLIAELDAGKALPDGQTDRAKYRQSLLDEIEQKEDNILRFRVELEKAQEVLKGVKPQVKKTREDRIAKYGW